MYHASRGGLSRRAGEVTGEETLGFLLDESEGRDELVAVVDLDQAHVALAPDERARKLDVDGVVADAVHDERRDADVGPPSTRHVDPCGVLGEAEVDLRLP